MNHAVVFLKKHIKDLEKALVKERKKFDYPHSEAFRKEYARLLDETMNFEQLKEIEKIKDPEKSIKALEILKKENGEKEARLKEMRKLSEYWHNTDNIDKHTDRVVELERNIRDCQTALMFIPKGV